MTMNKVKNKKQLRQQIDQATKYDKKAPLKKAFNLKDYDRIDEICNSSNVYDNMKTFIDACFKRRKKQYITIQILGLAIIMTLAGYIYTHDFTSSKELLYPAAWTFIILAYLLMDFFAYKRALRLYGHILELSKSLKKRKS